MCVANWLRPVMRFPVIWSLWIGLSLFLAHIPFFSPCLPLSCDSSASSPSLAPWLSLSSSYCSRNDLPCSELSTLQHKHTSEQTHTKIWTYTTMPGKYMQTHLIPLLLGPLLRWTDWEQSANARRPLHSLLLLLLSSFLH